MAPRPGGSEPPRLRDVVHRASWAVGAFLLGVVSQGVKLCVDTTLQEIIDDAYRGRVFAVYDMLFNATFAAAAAAAATWLPRTAAPPPPSW